LDHLSWHDSSQLPLEGLPLRLDGGSVLGGSLTTPLSRRGGRRLLPLLRRRGLPLTLRCAASCRQGQQHQERTSDPTPF
jgi:hypothetical protein